MAIYALSFSVFILAVLAMAVGVLAGRPAIKGSCGGLNRSGGDLAACDACNEPCPARLGYRRQGRHSTSQHGEAT